MLRAEDVSVVNGFYQIRESEIGEVMNELNILEFSFTKTVEYTLRNGENVIDRASFNDGLPGISGVVTFNDDGVVLSQNSFRTGGDFFINLTYGYHEDGLLASRDSEFSSSDLDSRSEYEYESGLLVRSISYRDGARFADTSFSHNSDGQVISTVSSQRESDSDPIVNPFECDVSYTDGLKRKVDCFIYTSLELNERRLFQRTDFEYDANGNRTKIILSFFSTDDNSTRELGTLIERYTRELEYMETDRNVPNIPLFEGTHRITL